MLFINNLISDIDSKGFIVGKTSQIELTKVAICLAVISDSINEISFRDIVEETKRRTKPTTNAMLQYS